MCSRFTERHQDLLTRHPYLAVEHALAELKRENISEKEKIYMVMVGGELLSVEELRRLDRRSKP